MTSWFRTARLEVARGHLLPSDIPQGWLLSRADSRLPPRLSVRAVHRLRPTPAIDRYTGRAVRRADPRHTMSRQKRGSRPYSRRGITRAPDGNWRARLRGHPDVEGCTHVRWRL